MKFYNKFDGIDREEFETLKIKVDLLYKKLNYSFEIKENTDKPSKYLIPNKDIYVLKDNND